MRRTMTGTQTASTTTRTARTPHARVSDAGNDVLNTLKRERIPVTGDLSDDEARCEIRLEEETFTGPSMYAVDPEAVCRVAAQERGVDVEFNGSTAVFTA